MNKGMLRAGRVLLCLLLALCLVSCGGAPKERTISNLERAGEPVEAVTGETPSPETGAEEAASEQDEPEDPDGANEKEEPSGREIPGNAKDLPEGETGPGRKEAGEAPAGTGKEYAGYKGPVQGEVKYKEGTPAGENSKEYKASGDIESPYKVELIVTRDFGHKRMYAQTVGLVRDEVGMEVLFRNLDIKTAYGGGFVNAINGLESGYTFFTGDDRKKLDWFYWVNGILAPVGVAEYRPQPGDVIWWDYHDWSTTMFIPAVIGSYPQPFKDGFLGKNPGTVIMHTPEYGQEALELKKSLEARGVKQVDTAALDPGVLKTPKKYYILLGLWEDLLRDSEVLKDINLKSKLMGVYVKFEDGEIKGMDPKGKVISSHSGAGAIYAYGSSLGSLNPAWVVTGTDDQGFRMALRTLLENPGTLKGYFGALVTKDGLINVPYLN